MTRFQRRAVFALGGLVAGAVIWVSVGVSQDKTVQNIKNPPAPGAPGLGAPGLGGPGSGAGLPEPAGVAPSAPPPGPGGPVPAFGIPGGADAAPGLSNPVPGTLPGRPSATSPDPTSDLKRTYENYLAPGGSPPPVPPTSAETPALKVIPLKRVRANSIKEIMETLLPAARGAIAIDAATNSLIVRVPASVLAEIEQLVNVLDSMEVNAGGSASQNGPRPGGLFGEAQQLGVSAGSHGIAPQIPRATRSTGLQLGDTIDFTGTGTISGMPTPLSELKKRYEAAERAAHEMARAVKANPGNVSHKQELRRFVSEAFSLRQNMLRADLEDVQRRLSTIQESIHLRDRVAEQIIERRINDLIDPNLQWEPVSSPLRGSGSPMGPASGIGSGPQPSGGVPGATGGPGGGSAGSFTLPAGLGSGGTGFGAGSRPVFGTSTAVPSNGGAFGGSGSRAGGEASGPGGGSPPSSGADNLFEAPLNGPEAADPATVPKSSIQKR